MSTSDSVQDRDLELLPVYTVKLWNEPISASTNKLKSSNSLRHRAKPKYLEEYSATGSWMCDNRRKTSPVTISRHMVVGEAVP